MLAHQTKQVTFLLPKIGTQNETLDSDIEEGCRPARFARGLDNFFSTSFMFQLFTLGRESECVANLCDETQIFTQQTAGYSDFTQNL